MKIYNLYNIMSLAATAASLAIAAVGCDSSDGLPRQPVSGRVTLDGEPLTKAWIQFRPDGRGGITAAGAMIDNGSYTVPRGDGLIPGDYRVVITKAEEPDAAAVAPEPAPGPKSKGKTAKLIKAVSPLGFAKQLIPAQYNVQTKLTAKVVDGQANNFDFPLSSK
jgi:hypothetical protein